MDIFGKWRIVKLLPYMDMIELQCELLRKRIRHNDLADASGIAVSTLSQLLNEYRKPSSRQLFKLELAATKLLKRNVELHKIESTN